MSDETTLSNHSELESGLSHATAGSETMDALECLARVASHIPDKGQVLQRYYGWYASRPRGMRRAAPGLHTSTEYSLDGGKAANRAMSLF